LAIFDGNGRYLGNGARQDDGDYQGRIQELSKGGPDGERGSASL